MYYQHENTESCIYFEKDDDSGIVKIQAVWAKPGGYYSRESEFTGFPAKMKCFSRETLKRIDFLIFDPATYERVLQNVLAKETNYALPRELYRGWFATGVPFEERGPDSDDEKIDFVSHPSQDSRGNPIPRTTDQRQAPSGQDNAPSSPGQDNDSAPSGEAAPAQDLDSLDEGNR